MKIGCAILAGGKSSRMGKDKALLAIDGKNFIEQISEELSWFEEKIIARGSGSRFSEEMETEWNVIPDIYPDHGPLGGIHAALTACESDALFVVTCDMPFIESSLARKLCESMTELEVGISEEIGVVRAAGNEAETEETSAKRYDAVISVEANGKVHPLCGVYRKSALPVLEEQLLSGRNKVMAALDKLQVKYVTIDSMDEAQQLSNINTPLDYEKLSKKTSTSENSSKENNKENHNKENHSEANHNKESNNKESNKTIK